MGDFKPIFTFEQTSSVTTVTQEKRTIVSRSRASPFTHNDAGLNELIYGNQTIFCPSPRPPTTPTRDVISPHDLYFSARSMENVEYVADSYYTQMNTSPIQKSANEQTRTKHIQTLKNIIEKAQPLLPPCPSKENLWKHASTHNASSSNKLISFVQVTAAYLSKLFPIF